MGHVHPLLDAARLVYDLQQVKEIAQSLSGQIDPTQIAHQVTEALVQRFGCALARIWLLEPDQSTLHLVASSGLYTHTNGSFARVPMGAYKVGKIAQNQVPFLSNHLSEETWVKDRQWAMDNHIQGFAGYPLAVGNRVLGVLASFSHSPFAPEFLEVLQVLCMTVTVALDAALTPSSAVTLAQGQSLPLSDQLAQGLGPAQLTLVGTERPLRPALARGLVQAAATLQQLNCSYCRLTYTPDAVLVEAIVALATDDTPSPSASPPCPPPMMGHSPLTNLRHWAASVGGSLDSRMIMQERACQVSLRLPAPLQSLTVQVQCRQPIIHQGMCQLIDQIGFTLADSAHLDAAAVGITDDPALLGTWLGGFPVLWVRHGAGPVPVGVAAVIDLNATAEHLQALICQVLQTVTSQPSPPAPILSERERQVMALLAEGKRDRAIAQALFISESTVKFHIKNSLVKLQAQNRYQGVYQAALQGWI